MGIPKNSTIEVTSPTPPDVTLISTMILVIKIINPMNMNKRNDDMNFSVKLSIVY